MPNLSELDTNNNKVRHLIHLALIPEEVLSHFSI